jgi:hypothetical protein
VLAQGSDRENRHTSWSTTSLKKYAGISWERGKVAIEGLIRKGFIARAEVSTAGKPRYELRPYADIERESFDAARAALTNVERHLLAEIRAGRETAIARKPVNESCLRDLEERRVIARQGDGSYTAVDVLPSSEPPDLIWLPNTLITGTEAGEEPPVRRLRNAGDLWALRLFVELYHAQNLRDDGGISPAILRQQFTRRLVGENSVFDVWGFKADQKTCWLDGLLERHRSRSKPGEKQHPIWDSLHSLERHGLINFVPHLWNTTWESGTAEFIHAYGLHNVGERLEMEMASAAHYAGQSMVPAFKTEKALSEGFRYLVPVPRNVPNVQMIGVARLRYRPHTTRTSDWYGDLVRNAPGIIARYKEVIEATEDSSAKLA